jgi:RNA polymerase sigma factor (TIGR02999 family)
MTESFRHQSQVTLLLQNAQQGNADAADSIIELLVADLHAIARNMMKSERAGHTLQATALVNEACLRLLKDDVISTARDKRYLFAAANRAMQQILVDHARSRAAQKRIGDREQQPLDILLDTFEAENGVGFEELSDALEALGKSSPRQREFVEHRYFGGFTLEDTAKLMGISLATAKRVW